MIKDWNDADANGDGKLDLVEARRLDEAYKAEAESLGGWYESDHVEENYNIFNSVSEGDGVTFDEYCQVLMLWEAKFEELRAADGL